MTRFKHNISAYIGKL